MKTLKITVLMLSMLFTGCEGYYANLEAEKQKHDNVLNSWMGAHKSKLIEQWGVPTRVMSNGNGGEVLIYEQAKTTGFWAYGSYHQNTKTQYTDMYADQSGILYLWRYGTR